MAFPPKYFYTLSEASGRWDCSVAQVVEWAIADEIDLVATFAPVMIGGEEIGGLMSVAGSEIRPLFRSVGRAEKKVCVRSVRPQGSTEWRLITSPAKGVKLTAGDIMITASEIERFGRGYTRAMALTLVPMLAVAVLRNRLVALERPRVILGVTASAIPLNAILNYVLMHGVGDWQGMGITGAGVSSLLVACFIAMSLGLISAWQGDRGADWWAWGEMIEASRLGLPIGISMLAEVGVYLGATLFAARFGPEPDRDRR